MTDSSPSVRVLSAPEPPAEPKPDPLKPRRVNLGTYAPSDGAIILEDHRGDRHYLWAPERTLLEVDQLLGSTPFAELWRADVAAARRELILSGSGHCLAQLSGGAWHQHALFVRRGPKAWHEVLRSSSSALLAVAALALVGSIKTNKKAASLSRWQIRTAPGINERRRGGFTFKREEPTVLECAALPGEILDDRFLLVSREQAPDEVPPAAA